MGEVQGDMARLRAVAAEVASTLSLHVKCSIAPAGCTVPPAGAKLCHFIRHGEGFHNVAQREWRANPEWDGQTEPYTLDTDPHYRFIDAELTDKGKGEAKALQPATEALAPELMVVSPMRRATLTGLLAFEAHLARGALPVLAHDLCHERAGKHTCDKRLPKAQLAALFPSVDYALLADEEDPYWGDGLSREDFLSLGVRAGRFMLWMLERPESHVVIAAHSAFLLASFNAVRTRRTAHTAHTSLHSSGPQVCSACVHADV